MPSGPVAESESRFDSKLSTLSEVKDTSSRDSWVRLGKVGTQSDGFRMQDFDANTEVRHSAFSRAVSVVRPFEAREGMEGERTPETDLIRRHQDFQEGERFENSDEMRKMLLSGSPEGRYTLVPSFMENLVMWKK